MGTLSYLRREDESREVFALNKVHLYATGYEYGEWVSVDAFMAWVDHDPLSLSWWERVQTRLRRWADTKRVMLISEHNTAEDPGDVHYGLSYDERRALITGSAFDDDYADDGVTYKPGSAW